MVSPGSQQRSRGARAGSLAYWTTALVVTLYVALTTGFRGEIRLIDGWEHHRVVRVMSQLGFEAGNPTYATSEPSIRYSPYSAALALVARHDHLDAWDVLSAAAVLNTAFLFVALYALLTAFGRTGVAFPSAVTILLLYGASPGYANTLALEDLPVHQGNPSAFALVLCIFSWAAWLRASRSSRATLLSTAAFTAFALAAATLSHGMSGALGIVGLLAVSIASGRRKQMLVATAIVSAAALALCMAWPYYPFGQALLHNPNPEYWYNPAILEAMLTSWCLPAMVGALLALPHRDDPLVRFGIVGFAATLLLTGVAVATRSATLARLPLGGLIFAHLLVGFVIAQSNLLSPSTWRAIIAGLRSSSHEVFAGAFVAVLLPLGVAFFGFPQFLKIAREPHLMRPLLAQWLHVPDKRSHLREHYREVLAPVAEHDVVMAAQGTGWPVPSFHGRIVAAEHFEFFTPSQRRRVEDVQTFMRPATPAAERIRLLDAYAARWILIDRVADERLLEELSRPEAIVRESGDLVLMDARRWRAELSRGALTH